MSIDIFKSLDALNAEIAEWETAFQARSYVVRGRVPLSDGSFLAYGKVGEQWRIVVETAAGDKLLASASIERRLEASELFEPLANVLRRERDAAVDRLQKRIEHLATARGKLPA